ncbi:hypothetical protein AMAG_02658 [Allomyces macrogynus ATCC 38327]|uniref:SH3 domain-containing protein n=1 Tax=Allomyces macrogynus (strain ATCC 38327) TaxID=578462 RepID=A0A0L0S2T8_ALLM3|nr:hypothetical protein AMAG_02658 [Allomyces macrogynus ATCC 38327]|eukprot:KNE56887.1 hypothetical protein AMAG_02658 [Allomyces macrogynus ATCC 38327]
MSTAAAAAARRRPTDCTVPLILAPATPPVTKLAAATEPVLPAPVKDVPLARAPHEIAQIAASQALAYTVYRGYLPRLNDELEVFPGDCVRVLAVFDDGWAWGDVVHRAPAPRPVGIFPLACLLAPNDDDEWLSDDEGDDEEAVESSSGDTPPHRASPAPSDAVLTRPDSATSLRRRSSARRRSGSSIGSTASSSTPPVVRAVRLPPRDDAPSPSPTSRTTGPLDLPQLAIGDWTDHDDVLPPPPPPLAPPVIAPVVPAAQPDRPAGPRRLLALARYAERSSSRTADPPSMAVHAAA